MSKQIKNKAFSLIIHQSTMVKWVSFGYLLAARDNGIEISEAAKTFANSSIFNEMEDINPEHIRVEFYRVLNQILDERKLDKLQQGIEGDVSVSQTGV